MYRAKSKSDRNNKGKSNKGKDNSKKDGNNYKPPKGGGGVSDSINVNGKTVNFGHGGRHLIGKGLDVRKVNQILADIVSKLNLEIGQFYKGRTIIDGVTIEYTTYRVSEDIINVGTYYIPLK